MYARSATKRAAGEHAPQEAPLHDDGAFVCPPLLYSMQYEASPVDVLGSHQVSAPLRGLPVEHVEKGAHMPEELYRP